MVLSFPPPVSQLISEPLSLQSDHVAPAVSEASPLSSVSSAVPPICPMFPDPVDVFYDNIVKVSVLFFK